MRVLKPLLLWLLSILLIFAALLFVDYARDRAPRDAPMGEQVTRDEEYLTAQIINSAIDVSIQSRSKLMANSRDPKFKIPSSSETSPGYAPDQYRRDAHPKGHGCVLASFTVRSVDTRYAYGVFARSRAYDAIIRFSSGNPDVRPDAAKDVRGMAIKLMNVEGPKLLPLEESGSTQDFVLMNNPVFFIRTLGEYAELNGLLAQGNAYGYFFGGPTFNILRWHLRELLLGLRAQKSRPDSLMTTRFWSGSSYSLGPNQYVKYGVIPCAANKPMPDAKSLGQDRFDYLRLELARQSLAGTACFDFAVQTQVQGKNMPVEDTTVEWKESDSPFVPVARIALKAGDTNTEAMNSQCENTAFNPWHSLADHRPVGVMNRIRKALYPAMARFRQGKNCGEGCAAKCNPLNLPDNACWVQQP